VKKESRDRWLALADWAIRKLGFEDWDEGLRFASSVLDAFAEKVRSINTREKLDALLAEMPEPDEKALDEDITTAKEFVYQFRERLVRFAKDKLPHSPGGHPRLIPISKDDEIRESISVLQRKHVPLGDAFERIAQRESVGRRRPVSPRTIERIWHAREREKVAGEAESETSGPETPRKIQVSGVPDSCFAKKGGFSDTPEN
jgi:hypothetical protein